MSYKNAGANLMTSEGEIIGCGQQHCFYHTFNYVSQASLVNLELI